MQYLSSVKKIFILTPIVIINILSFMISGCSQPSDAKIDGVYFAQKHVMEPENELFKLFSNLETLIKVHVVSPSQSQAPDVQAILNLNGKTLTMQLAGPDKLPDSIPNGRGLFSIIMKIPLRGLYLKNGCSQALASKSKPVTKSI